MKKIFQNIPFRKTIIPCFLFAVLLSGTIIIGRSLYIYGSFSGILSSSKVLITNLLTMLVLVLIFTAVFTSIYELVKKYQNIKSHNQWVIFKYPLIYCGVIFLCWLPCYLAYYPGIISYDMHEQMPQALGTIAYSKYHPPLHTFFLDICLSMGDFFGINGLVIYSLLQMLMLSFAFTYLLRFLIKRKVRNWIILTTLLFICFNPVIAIFSFIPVKDALFTVFFIMYSVELCEFISEKEHYLRNYFAISRLILFALLCCLLRNNMVYALAVATIFMVLFVKKYRKQILLWNTITILIYSIINGPIYNALGVKGGNSREMLSIPIQQITYVVTSYQDSFSPDEIEKINDYLPFEELHNLYNPRLADYAKVTFNTEKFEENKGAFIKLWFDLFLQYPDEYFVAFLNLNLPYWYIDANTLDEYSKRDYIETYIMDPSVINYTVERDSKIPWLYEKYEQYAGYEFIQDTPIVSTFFSISTPIWIILFSTFAMFAYKRKELVIVFLPAICYWLTFLLGPVSNFRYVFPLVALYPLYITLFLDTKKIVTDDK